MSSYFTISLRPKRSEGDLSLVSYSRVSEVYDELYEGMDQIMSQKWIATTWHFLQVRAKIYEDFRNKKC